MSFRPTVFVMIAAFVMVPAVALAAHGKVGLWASTTTVSIPNMPAMSIGYLQDPDRRVTELQTVSTRKEFSDWVFQNASLVLSHSEKLSNHRSPRLFHSPRDAQERQHRREVEMLVGNEA